MNSRMLIAVVVSMFVCQQVHAQAEDEPEAEATELEGTWEIGSGVREGEQHKIPDGAQLRFEGNRFYGRADDGVWELVGTFSVDPSATPTEIDFIDNENEATSGIYKIEDDLLTICAAFLGGSRPDKFESPAESLTFLMVLRRVEDDE